MSKKKIYTDYIRYISPDEGQAGDVRGIDFGAPIRMVWFDLPLYDDQVPKMVDAILDVYGFERGEKENDE